MKIRVEQRDLDCFGVKIIRPSDPEFSEVAGECSPPICTKNEAPRPMWFEAMRRGRG
jgi:hypothetical protein